MVDKALYIGNKTDSKFNKRLVRGVSEYFDAPSIVMYTYEKGNNKNSDIFDTDDFEEVLGYDTLTDDRLDSPDVDFLKQFEEKHGLGRVWRGLSADRGLVKRGWTGFFHIDRSPYTHEELLAKAEREAKDVTRLFERYEFDFVFGQGSSNLRAILAHAIAESRNIPWFSAEMARVSDRYVLTDDINDQSTYLKTVKERLADNGNVLQRDDVQEFIESVQNGASAYHQTSLDALEDDNTTQNDGLATKVTKIPDAVREHYRIKYGSESVGRVSAIERIYYKKLKNIRQKIDPFLIDFDEFEPDRPYVHFPLHAQPEKALMVWTRYYNDFPAVVRNIAQSLPVGMELYVNEHPEMFGVREPSFYDRLRRLPHVRVIPHEVPTDRIVNNADAILTISSTVGLEALIRDVPVVALGYPCYGWLDTVYDVETYEELPETIHDATRNGVDMEEVATYIAAALDVGVSRTNPEFELRIAEQIDEMLD